MTLAVYDRGHSNNSTYGPILKFSDREGLQKLRNYSQRLEYLVSFTIPGALFVKRPTNSPWGCVSVLAYHVSIGRLPGSSGEGRASEKKKKHASDALLLCTIHNFGEAGVRSQNTARWYTGHVRSKNIKQSAHLVCRQVSCGFHSLPLARFRLKILTDILLLELSRDVSLNERRLPHAAVSDEDELELRHFLRLAKKKRFVCEAQQRSK